MKKSLSTVLLLASLTSAPMLFTACSSDNDPIVNPIDDIRENLKGEIKNGEHIILETGVYKLTGALIVQNGGKLTVKPGVVIEATPYRDGEEIRYIAVAQGGQIFAEGTKEKPVIFTSTNKTQQAWGGVVLCGKAPINKGNTANAEVSGLPYGGTQVDDNSGIIRYARIEYSGYSYSSDKEFNGLSMFGVGAGTTIEYVQVHEGSDDGFEWFGGTVNTKYLVSTSNEDDLFDWTEGWNGTNEYWYGKEAANKGNRGVEADNNSNNHLAGPISNPTIKNLTLIGRGASSSEPQAMKLRVGTKTSMDNVFLSNWSVGIDIEHDESVGYVTDGSLKISNVKFENITTKSKGTKTVPQGSPEGTKGASVDVSAAFTENNNATGAGAGSGTPEWAKGWTVGI
ncbi:hypothetical protein EDC17_10341 [Sphingobacterium alimentarium]|uniref:Parallel beta helix pectate lyase-like protein n=1 Tax=Sphingobacterium alimentarium TaxID=797292 RepID=A0A4R3VRA3_9SPHI|nr:hypothetical protein [Sphingobacterium alimentarium]TCV10325.1 hypothetical protein EDC17_10341 [Sphingobacterium alimentarium]